MQPGVTPPSGPAYCLASAPAQGRRPPRAVGGQVVGRGPSRGGPSNHARPKQHASHNEANQRLRAGPGDAKVACPHSLRHSSVEKAHSLAPKLQPVRKRDALAAKLLVVIEPHPHVAACALASDCHSQPDCINHDLSDFDPSTTREDAAVGQRDAARFASILQSLEAATVEWHTVLGCNLHQDAASGLGTCRTMPGRCSRASKAPPPVRLQPQHTHTHEMFTPTSAFRSRPSAVAFHIPLPPVWIGTRQAPRHPNSRPHGAQHGKTRHMRPRRGHPNCLRR